MSVLIYIQNWEGKFKKTSYELLSYGAAIAKNMNVDAYAISIGNVAEEELKKVGNYGITKVISVSHDAFSCFDESAFSIAINEVALKEKSNVVLFANNLQGKAIAPRLAVKLKSGLATLVNGLPISYEPFVVTKKVFSGKAISKMKILTAVKLVTLAQNSYGIVENTVSVTIENYSLVSAIPSVLKVTDVQKTASGKILLTDAEIVVSGGRGMKGPENWGTIEELASLLGAATACSRPVSDDGWRSHTEHVGQTGKMIAPNLYIACGISGAIQHLAGVSSSKVIVAFNKDPEAPIFEAANYGVIGDVLKILPEFVNALKEFKKE